MTIKAHCMGMEFPKEHKHAWGPWLRSPFTAYTHWRECLCGAAETDYRDARREPTAADLDAVAEEQRVKDKTSR